jgi:AcrR family transcriptional regulator
VATTARSAARTAAARSTRPSADATRDRILAAAIDVFSEQSFDGASTREIANRAGVTQPLLNYHYRSKDDLWRAAVDTLFQRIGAALITRIDGLRGVDELTTAKLVVREFVTFSARNPQLHRLITQESKADSERMDYLVDHHVRPFYDAIAAMFERLAAQGAVAPIAPAHLYYLLTGAGATIFVLAPECRRLSGIDPTADDVIDAHADAVCALLFRDDARPSR